MATDDRLRFTELEARIEALESLLAERSNELRLLQARLCARDLAALEQLRSDGVVAASVPPAWEDGTALTAIEVEEALVWLWGEVERDLESDGETV